MKKLIKLILLTLYINTNPSYLYGENNSIEVLRSNTTGSTLKMMKVVSSLYSYNKNIDKTEFKRTHDTGHAFVVNNKNGTTYDSGNGVGGTINTKIF